MKKSFSIAHKSSVTCTKSHPFLKRADRRNKTKETATAAPNLNLTPSPSSPFPLPEFQTISIVKKDDAPIGIKMEQTASGKLVIAGIDEKSPLACMGAEVGREIVMVNGSTTNSTKTAATLIRSSPPQRTITLVTADPARSPLYKLVHLPPHTVRWTSVRDGTLLRVSRLFSSSSQSSGLAEGDLLLAVQGRPVSTPEEARQAMQSAAEGNDHVSFYVLDHQLLRDTIWKAVVQRIHTNRYKELTRDLVDLQPIPDTFEDRTDVHGIFLHQKLKARVVFDCDTYRMTDLWQYWSAYTPYGKISHDSPLDYHRNSYKKILAVMREYNRILEHNLRQLEETVCQKCWSLGHSVARAPMVAEFASVQVEDAIGDDDDSIPLATATYF